MTYLYFNAQKSKINILKVQKCLLENKSVSVSQKQCNNVTTVYITLDLRKEKFNQEFFKFQIF